VMEKYLAKLEALKAEVEKAKQDGNQEKYEDAVRRLRNTSSVAFEEMSRVRHQTAVAKVPHVIEYVDTILANMDERNRKVVVFAHHHDVIDKLAEHYGDRAVVLTGQTSMADRQRAVDRFQKDSNVEVFIGSITAAGVGLTLTAANQVVFAEIDWVPANMTQAEDRLHRIGQESSVNVYHLVLEGSIDARMVQVLLDKQEIADRALDNKTSTETAPIGLLDLMLNKEPKKIKALSESEVQGVHLCLIHLASLCDGARQLDGMGFNKIDTDFGRKLARRPRLTQGQALAARKMLRKYRRQIPDDLWAKAFGVEQQEESK